MSLPEVVYRVRRMLADRREKSRLLSGKTNDSVELLVSRLEGEASTLEEKFQLVFSRFRARNVFPWQQQSREQLLDLYERYFPENKASTIRSAKDSLEHKFRIFDTHVCFEKMDWHYDPLLQRSIPLTYWSDLNYYSADVVKEVKYVWELNRHQHFVTLAKAYFLTGDERYVAELLHQWRDWIENNPYKFGINWTSALECAFRLMSWTWALQFVKDYPKLNPALYVTLLSSVQQHVHFIRQNLSFYSSANNHLIGEALGLIYAGCYYPEFPEAPSWRELGFKLLFEELPSQVHNDGVSKEQTTYYQRYIFDFGLLAVLAANYSHVQIPDAVSSRLERMAEFIYAIMDENGHVPHIGDEDSGEALRLAENESPYRQLLCTAGAWLQRNDFQQAAGPLSESTFWLLAPNTVEIPNDDRAKTTKKLFIFPDGGYVVARDTFRSDVLVFDCGPLGLGKMAAHGHADALSFTYSLNGEPVLIDSGTYLYMGAGEERAYFRGTRAHSTVRIDDRDQSEMLGPFQWGKRASTTLHDATEQQTFVRACASHDGYDPIIHSRTLTMDQKILSIVDDIKGFGNHKMDVYFHLAPCEVEQHENCVVCHFQHSRLTFSFFHPSALGVRMQQTWFSPSFGEKQKHPVIQITGEANLPVSLETTIKIDAKNS